MTKFQIAFLVIFGITSIIHLVFCYLEKENARMISKPLCLFFLMIATIPMIKAHPGLFLGAMFSCIGDIFLIWNKKEKMFMAGTISFFVAHLMHLIELVGLLTFHIPWFVYLIAALVGVGVDILLCKTNTKTYGKLLAPFCNYYAFTLIIMFAMSFILAVTGSYKNYAVMLVVGYASFIVSDLILSKTTFEKDIKRRDFPIMITYLIGELFIIMSLMLMYSH